MLLKPYGRSHTSPYLPFINILLLQLFTLGVLLNDSPSAALSTTKFYDLVVIGGGSAGLTAAKFAATFGKTTCIIEEEKLGGDCTWTGCVPSKALLASAKSAHAVRKSKEFGVSSGEVVVDMMKVKERLIRIQKDIYEADDSPEVMKKLGVETIEGRASFASSDTLLVEGRSGSSSIVANEGIVICTGAKAIRPSGNTIAGLESVKYLTYEEVFELDTLPQRLTVVGGGPIGCELSQAFSRLGSTVTQIAPKLLSSEEPEVARAMEQVFETEGVQRIKSTVASVSPGAGESHVAICSDGSRVEGDVILVAVGRAPNVDIKGLKDVGVKLNSMKGIDVDSTLRTAVKRIYAAGDCTGDAQFTHYAGYQGAVAARNVLLPLTDPGVLSDVPATTFTSPEVASVGLSEKEAREKYKKSGTVSVAYKEIKDVDRAECESEHDGFIKIIYKTKSYEILGATIVSTAAGEMISEISVAIKAKMKFDTLATVMHSYPSYSFALQAMAAEVYYDKLLRYKGLFSFLKKLGL